MRRRIAEQAIAPGAKIREQDLVREFGLTRPYAREVLLALEARGLVEIVPNSGGIVRRLDLDQVFEIYDAREVLEGLCVRLATRNAPPSVWAAHLARLDDELEAKVRGGDVAAYLAVFLDIRSAIIAAANNPVVAEFLDRIFERTAVIMRRVLILPGRAATALAQQREILRLMAEGRAEDAESARRANVRSAIAELRRYRTFVL